MSQQRLFAVDVVVVVHCIWFVILLPLRSPILLAWDFIFAIFCFDRWLIIQRSINNNFCTFPRRCHFLSVKRDENRQHFLLLFWFRVSIRIVIAFIHDFIVMNAPKRFSKHSLVFCWILWSDSFNLFSAIFFYRISCYFVCMALNVPFYAFDSKW